jgi:hypothetical protein
MRWKADPTPKEGDIRYRNKFAWFPTQIGNEIVWLERFGIHQKYMQTVRFDSDTKTTYPVMEWVEIDRYTLDYYC